jgi:hypothetical protein
MALYVVELEHNMKVGCGKVFSAYSWTKINHWIT